MPNPTAVLDPHSLSQGNIQTISDLVFGTPTGDAVTITSAGSNIPTLKDKEYFEIRGNSNSVNNGLYQVDDATPAANSVDVRKVSGPDPVVEAVAESNQILCALETAVSDAVWANQSLNDVDITSAGGNLPTFEIGARFEVRNHSDADNNGGYEVNSTVTNGYNCTKITGAEPNNAASEAVDVDSERKSIFYDTSALGFYILEQPGLADTAVSDAVWQNTSGANTEIQSTGANLPTVRIGQYILVRNHATAANNGYYKITGIPTVNTLWEVEMVSDGLTPADAASEAVDMQTDPLVDDTGGFGQPIYSRMMIDWKDDNFLIRNAGFPMFNIDSDAGKYLMGQNASGTNTGWNFVDNAEFGIRSRKLVRNMGWQEINSDGLVTAEYAAIRSNATVEDNDRDLGYFQFGTDTTKDDTVDFEFAGPVDESILVYDATVTRAQATLTEGYDFNDTGDTIDRNDGGSFITDGYKVGSLVIVENAETSADNGTYRCTAVAAAVLTVENLDGSAVTFSDTSDDNTATLTLDNRFAFALKLRPRDDDTFGKSFAQQGLADALATQLSNRAFIFGLGTVVDLNISETDANIDANTPYTGMSITFYATPQSLGGGSLVGGAQNFGIVIDGNNGTTTEIYEWTQRQLRKFTDIDADADTAIGRAIDGLLRFNGSVLEFGSVDGGLSFPTNPDGGGSGVYCLNVNAVNANDVAFFDNTGTLRTNEETIAVTLDFNDILIDDTIAEADLFFDRTIRTSVADLVVTAGTGANGTITSAGTNLPNPLDVGVGAYIRLAGLTGGDAAMNGVYQVTAITTPGADWSVTRLDGDTVVTTSSAAVNVDEHPFDTPDALIVNTALQLTDTTISFTSPDTIGDTNSGFGIFAVGETLRISGAGAGTNAGKLVKILTVVAGTITIETGQFWTPLDTQAAGGSVTLQRIASVEADSDFSFSFEFDANVQGGRVVSTETFVKAKALGRETAQYTESAVLSIQSGTPLVVPLQSQQERNVEL
jgi:hypothetical protein